MDAQNPKQKPTPKGSAVRWTEADLYDLVYPSEYTLRQAARYWRTHAPTGFRRLLEAKRDKEGNP